MLIQKVLEAAAPTVQEIADEADLSTATLWAWSKETRNPRGRSLIRLAEVLEARSGRLAELAQELREAAGER